MSLERSAKKIQKFDNDKMDLLGLGFLALELRTPKSGKKMVKFVSGWRRQENGKRLAIITLDELSWHDTTDDCWIAIYDYVYNCTEFLKKHPGGSDILAEYAGRDATLAFIGAGHTEIASDLLKNYLIGELPVNEKLFRKHGGIKIINTS